MTGQVVAINPAQCRARAEHSVKKGKTSVLDANKMGDLLASIDTDSVIGLRDRALIALMGCTFARVSHRTRNGGPAPDWAIELVGTPP